MADGRYATHSEQLVITPEGTTVVGPSRDRDGPFGPGRVTVEGAAFVDLADDGQSMTITFEQEDV